jgi:hypothetical protein
MLFVKVDKGLCYALETEYNFKGYDRGITGT